MKKQLIYLFIFMLFISACSIQKSPESKESKENILENKYGDLIIESFSTADNTIKQRQRVLRTENYFIAPEGSIKPFIDGNINQEEWSDANFYEVSTHNIQTNQGEIINMYFKTFKLDQGIDECILYDSNPEYKIPCGEYLFIGLIYPSQQGFINRFEFIFDEGNDSERGSGSKDEELLLFQEDLKSVRVRHFDAPNEYCHTSYGVTSGCPELQCMPWNQENCWKCANNFELGISGNFCVLLNNSNNNTIISDTIPHTHVNYGDGSINNGSSGGPGFGWISYGPIVLGTYPYLNHMHSFFGLINNEFNSAELIIPLIGGDFLEDENGGNSNNPLDNDLSDLTVNKNDEIGFKFYIELDNPEYVMIFGRNVFPGDNWDPNDATSFATLKLSASPEYKQDNIPMAY